MKYRSANSKINWERLVRHFGLLLILGLATGIWLLSGATLNVSAFTSPAQPWLALQLDPSTLAVSASTLLVLILFRRPGW